MLSNYEMRAEVIRVYWVTSIRVMKSTLSWHMPPFRESWSPALREPSIRVVFTKMKILRLFFMLVRTSSSTVYTTLPYGPCHALLTVFLNTVHHPWLFLLYSLRPIASTCAVPCYSFWWLERSFFFTFRSMLPQSCLLSELYICYGSLSNALFLSPIFSICRIYIVL